MFRSSNLLYSRIVDDISYEFTKLNQWVTLVESTNAVDSVPYFHLKVPDYVYVLALDENGFVPLVKQYRIPQYRVTLELPAGLIEDSQSPIDAAIKELAEETGVSQFRKIIQLPTMILDSGRIENSTFAFVVLGAQRPSISDCRPTELETRWVSCDELISLAVSGMIDHMGQVALILWAAREGYLSSEVLEFKTKD